MAASTTIAVDLPRTDNISPMKLFPFMVPLPIITKVAKKTAFSYYGPLSDALLKAASDFLVAQTDTKFEETYQCLDRFLASSYLDCKGTHAEKAAFWLVIRLTKPSSDFEVPRWHQDGRMYPYDEGRQEVVRSKYGTTLLGPPTLMLPVEQRVFDTLRAGFDKFLTWRTPGTKTRAPGKKPLTDEEFNKANDDLRKWLAEQYKDEKRIAMKHGDVVRFSWGRDDSPLHSEPDLATDRVFMTVLYGSESELKRMCEWRGEYYGKLE